MEPGKEKENLNKIAGDSLYTTFSNTTMIQYCYKVLSRFVKPGSILELGPAEGVMTEYLVHQTSQLTLVDGSEVFCDRLRTRFPQTEVINSLFEDFKPTKLFDNIVLGHVLEHVEDPVSILKLCKTWLAPNGIVLGAVPNSRSLHRQAAVIMGLMHSEDTMSELDHHHGHRRIYNPESFRTDFLKAGLNIDHFGGYWLKPLSNAQIHQYWNSEMLGAFMALGERYPDVAAEIYVVATK